ncbi:hypothetical protein FHS27_003984 [Rhodopirellula rubra]|uniref:Secreted protein n=1 Tax=Aporhodopirellula rubra TaxID=980271 RepID=A0A7W5E2K3_9BACT|nr:hypothetical protein [Aporhodopirellula rubra]MBB3208157.1 hypothetical protein [Aporhodopirellula rubra]
MKKLSALGCLLLLSICLTPMAIVGCGADSGSKVVKPDMSAEEIQAKADAKADADEVDPT